MWKPGTAAPPKAAVMTVTDETSANVLQEPSRAKSLSGATLNMRFMKRKEARASHKQQQLQQQLQQPNQKLSSPHPTVSSPAHSTALSPAQLTTIHSPVSDPRKSFPLSLSSPHATTETQSPGPGWTHRKMNNLDDDSHLKINTFIEQCATTTVALNRLATANDMWGSVGCNQFGRRSFGRFNPSLEATWKGIRKALDDDGEKLDEECDDRSRRKNKQNKQSRRKSEENVQRPIGNLDSKGIREPQYYHQQPQSSSGKKRKLATSLSSSQRTEQLQDVLLADRFIPSLSLFVLCTSSIDFLGDVTTVTTHDSRLTRVCCITITIHFTLDRLSAGSVWWI